MYGSSRLSSLRCMLNACHSWPRRSRAAALRAACASALAALFSAVVRDLAIVTKDTDMPVSLEAGAPGARASAACSYSRPARYDDRTSGPASTPAKPSPSACCANSTNSSGRTQRSTGWWRADGRRYWVMVTMSQPASCRSASAVRTSSGVSPRPRMRLLLVTRPKSTRRGEHAQAALVGERGPDPLEDARHGFDVVRQHFRAGLEDLREPGGLAVEVGNQQFDAGRIG